MPHNGYRPFDASGIRRAFPDFRITPWREGIAATCRASNETRAHDRIHRTLPPRAQLQPRHGGQGHGRPLLTIPTRRSSGGSRKALSPSRSRGFRNCSRSTASRITYTSNLADLATCSLVFYALDVRTNDAQRKRLGTADGPDRSDGRRALERSRRRRHEPGAARHHALAHRPASKLHAGALVLPGGDTDLRRGRAAGHGARALHRRGRASPRARSPRPTGPGTTAFGCPVLAMRYESAELAKIAINLFLVSTRQHDQHACRALRGDRRRLGGDRPGAAAGQADRAPRLPEAGARHRGRKPRARPGHREGPGGGVRHRGRDRGRLDAQQRAREVMGVAHP